MTATSADSARAAVLTAPRQIELVDLPVPAVGADDGLLRPELVGICGTDCKLQSGVIPAPTPLILGHEIVGVIAEVGEIMAERLGVGPGDRVVVETSVPCWSCRECWSGEYRFCPRRRAYGINTSIATPPGLWGALAERMYLAPGAIVHRIPAAMTTTRALVSTLLANGVEWLQYLGGLRAGDRVVILGCGPQGLAAALIALHAGAGSVVVTGLHSDAARLNLARRLGVSLAMEADADDVPRTVLELTEGLGADLVLDVTGDPEGPARSIQLARTRGTVVLAGLSGRKPSSFVPDDVVNRQIRVQGAFVKGDRAFRAALTIAHGLGAQHAIDEIVSDLFPLERAADAISSACVSRDAHFVKAAVTI
jgi:threonine dehydrogenase-like Zn-dependent dehydrogenase